MPRRRRRSPTPASPPDPTGRWQPAPGLLALALVVAAGAPLAWLWAPTPGEEQEPDGPVAQATSRPADRTRPTPGASPSSGVEASAQVAALPVRAAAYTPASPAARPRDPDGDPTPDLRDYLNPGEAPPMAEVIARLQAAGVTGGLAAFQPPGTRPPLVGLAVPDDYVLPEGYVRHHQATDDGRRIEPILMYSPDYQWFDAAGRPIALPTNRVVPLEHAPPGLPLRHIVLPAPAEPGR
jgi:hypothetical protein